MDRLFIEVRINPNKPDDQALDALVNEWKEQGELSDAIRAALPLLADLQAGRLDMLFYLFPHLQRHFVQDTVLDKMPYVDDCADEFVGKLVEVAMQAMLPPAIYRVYVEGE